MVKVQREQADREALATRLSSLAVRVGLTPDQLVEALEGLAGSLPRADEDHPTGDSLSVQEEEAYRSVGGLRGRMPALPDRASTLTFRKGLRLAAEGLTVDQAAQLLRVSPGRVRQRISDRTLRAVKRGGAWHVLACQFTDSGEVLGVGEVVSLLPKDAPAVAVDRFLTEQNPDLVVEGRIVSPIDWLLMGGDVETVASIAANVAILP